MFHYSSLFVSVLYLAGRPFFDRIYTQTTYVLLIALSFFLSFAHAGRYILLMMPGHFGRYAHYEISVSILKLLAINGLFLFFMFQQERFIRSRLDRYLLNSIFLGLIIFNIFSDYVYVSRLAQYFLVAEIVLVPLYLFSIEAKKTRKIMAAMFLLYYGFNYDYALYRDEHFSSTSHKYFLIPYKNYFFEERKPHRQQYIEAWYDFILENEEKGEGQ
jgi:hypothetical protein